MNKKFLIVSLLMGIFISSGVLAYSNPSSNWQANQPTFDDLYAGNFDTYWPILGRMKDGQCNATTDFVIGIPPGGCSPSVVRSDLLAEQNVPVFCQLYAIKVNPLIKVSSIKSISFKGDYPKGVRSIVYHPARAAVKSYSTLIGSPTLENIGYVVIILKQERVEANITREIFGNLTATMTYDSEKAYGTGRADYYLEPMNDEQWQKNFETSSFWNGRGYLRVSDVSDGRAKIQIMAGQNKILRSLNLKEGETSSSSYLPGFYCKAGLKVKLTDITVPEDMALLNIDGQSIWVRDGSKFLGGKCRVRDLNVKGNNDGDISISCSGSGKIKPLSLKGMGARFKISVKGEKVDVEKKLGDNIDGDWYLAYVGKMPKGVDDKEGDFAVLVSGSKDSKDSSAFSFAADKLIEYKGTPKAFAEEFRKSAKITDGDIRKGFLLWGDKGYEERRGIKFLGTDNIIEDEGTVNPYFTQSVDVVKNELVADYGREEKEIGGTWAEAALFEEIKKAGELGQFSTKKNLMDLFLNNYPLSKMESSVRDMRAKLDGTDYSNSYVSTYVGDEFRSISVVDFKIAREGSKRVDLRVGNVPKNNLTEIDGGVFNDSENGVDMKGHGKIEIESILPGKVSIEFKTNVKDPKGDEKSRTIWINEGESATFDGVRVYVKNVRVNEVAHVSLIPDVKHDKSEADFSFRINVEKRAIQLSPEKTKEMIKNLNASIKKWDNIVNRLGQVVTGLKGACFATSAVLMIKNMVSGVSGEAAARTKVMGKYKEICQTDSKYKDMSLTQCYNNLSGSIRKSVAATAGALAAVNVEMKSSQSENVKDSDGLFGGKGIIDNAAYRKSLAEKIRDKTVDINISSKEVVLVNISGNLSVSQLQSIMLWKKAVASGDKISADSAKAAMDVTLRNVALRTKENFIKTNIEKDFIFNIGGKNIQFPVSVLSEGKTAFSEGGVRISKGELMGIVNGELELSDNIEKDEKVGVHIIHSGSSNYLYLFDGSLRQLGIYRVQRRDSKLKIDGKKLDYIPERKGVIIQMIATGSCSNPWPKGKAQVKYYESGDNKGLPAIVPFDLTDGWYVWVKNSGGTYVDDSVQGYKASGDVRNFYICNIGANGLMQTGTGDDMCQSFDANSAGKVSEFRPCPKMTSSEVTKLYEKARQAIQQASRQYGESSVNIFGKMISVGKPMSAVGGFECQDFMSPEDCLLMFNVCDPVICPPSRCDFGGKFHVSDVIQSGIIGSLALCLPNAKEGIKIPICLSGVQAGLDSYLSILKSEKDCLQHSLDTGEMVGICDQITSVYKCEFFWRQISPLMDQMIPGIIDYAIHGNRVRGGGEYALVAQSWNTMKQSVSYFKNIYAQNAFKAFNIRSTQEIGSSFCKAFIGTSVPGSANFINDLLAPESPSQFYAQFSEQLFSEATVPSTSQYKIYFHIYAGHDEGVQYKVYLRDPPSTSYYASTPEISDGRMSGYIAAGSSADKTVDFTAPSGYKELCVVINAKTECGFKQTTTNFGLNMLSKKFAEEQAKDKDITTEKRCISGSPSALSMATLNIQAGAQEVANPDISLRGIVRVCASANPDAGVSSEDLVSCSDDKDCGTGFKCGEDKFCVSKEKNSNVKQKAGSRWEDVGYCGDVKLRCWLDVDSVKDDLEAVSAFEGKSISLLDKRKGLIENERLNLDGVAALLGKARGDIKKLTISKDENEGKKIIFRLERVIGNDSSPGAGTNGGRAEALALKASVLRLLADNIAEEKATPPVVAVRPEVNPEVTIKPVEVNKTKVVREVVDKETENIKKAIKENEGSRAFVYDIGGAKHIGVGHKITAESRSVFMKLFGCDTSCFDDLVDGKTSLTSTQVDELFTHDINIYIKRTKNLFPSYDSYPDYIKMALVSSVYRGEMESGHETVKLINEGKWREAAVEYINRKDYREAAAKGLGGIVKRMDANRDSFLRYAGELEK